MEPEQLPVSQARAGEAEAWSILFKRYQLPLYTYAYELTRHEQNALDITQETFINAARHIGRLRDDAKFGSWLFGIAHQKCLQLWRKKRIDTAEMDELDALPDDQCDPGELLINEEQEALFMKLLEQLSPSHRAVLTLHFLEDFSIEEIATVTQTSAGTVKSRLHYAKNSLRRILTQK